MRPPHFSLFILSLAVGLSACSPSKEANAPSGGKKAVAVPVVAANVEQKEVPVQLISQGTVRAKSTVAVKPRVTGQIAKVLFQEGQDVKAGDILVEIDPAPFEVVLAQAKARLAQAKTQADIAKKQADRYTNLVTSGGVSREEVDNLKSTADAAASNTEAAAASVKEAELQLSYCTVRSPISGRAGRRAVDAGNVIKADESDLVVVNQLRPIEVIFSVPEQNFTDIQHYMSKGELKVSIKPSGIVAREITGALSFVDNAIKTATGTLEVKATMANEDLILWPGQYGEIALTLTSEPNAIVIPAPAIQTGQNGQYVFVIKDDHTVELRAVELKRTVGSLAIIRKGLKPGEQVVIDGQLRLVSGSKVEIKPPVGSVSEEDVAQSSPPKA
ncbi:MAG: efflux RND transporter periplasmic adaptor subunit [Prosthecobacter sp.]|nr:efflux RND transporter periplasmic adaptor subunit [Prosthecobacter sp.]